VTTSVPAVITESLAAATGRTRSDIESFIGVSCEKLEAAAGEISRQVGTIASGNGPEARKADAIAQVARATILSDQSIQTRLRAALGFTVIGGLVASLEGALAMLVGIALLVIAGLIVFGLLRELINRATEQLGQANF